MDHSICFFATLIENLPVLMEKISKDSQSKIKILVFVSVFTWTQAGKSGARTPKKRFLAARLIQLICPRYFNSKTYGLYLLPVRTTPVINTVMNVKNWNQMQNAADFGAILSM